MLKGYILAYEGFCILRDHFGWYPRICIAAGYFYCRLIKKPRFYGAFV